MLAALGDAELEELVKELQPDPGDADSVPEMLADILEHVAEAHGVQLEDVFKNPRQYPGVADSVLDALVPAEPCEPCAMQLTTPPPTPKAPAPGNHESSPEAQPVACRIEFHGEKALLSLDSSRSRAAEQTFEILVAAQKFEVRYELPRGRAKALRTLRRGTFNSHVMTCDSITDLPTTAGLSSYAHDWVHSRPRSRNTWRPLATISAKDEAKKRTPNYEYWALSKPGFWAVTLEMADGSKVSARSSSHPFTPQGFAAGLGKRILALLGAVRRRNGK